MSSYLTFSVETVADMKACLNGLCYQMKIFELMFGLSLGLFFSVNIMDFDFLHFVFSKCNTYIMAGNITWKDYVEISTYFLWKSLTEKRIRRLALFGLS